MRKQKTAAGYYRQLISERRRQLADNSEEAGWRYRTLLKHITAQKHMELFAPNMMLDDVSEEWMDSMEKHLIGKGYANSYVRRLMRDIKAFLNWAYGMGYMPDADFRRYHPKCRDETDRIVNGNKFALSLNELQLLQQLDLTGHPCLRETRDMFLFCCHTGLRFSDAVRLQWNDIGTGTIRIVTQKTKQWIDIPVTAYMQKILDNYRYRCLPTVFLPVTNMTYNTRLKRVGRMAGLTDDWIKLKQCGCSVHKVHLKKFQCLSSHVARRTFSTIALQQGIPVEVIMSITGHTTPKMLHNYMKISTDMKRRYMERFNVGTDMECHADTDIERIACQIAQLSEEEMARLLVMVLRR